MNFDFLVSKIDKFAVTFFCNLKYQVPSPKLFFVLRCLNIVDFIDLAILLSNKIVFFCFFGGYYLEKLWFWNFSLQKYTHT